MTRTIDILAESLASVEQVSAAFGREDYWLARVAGDGAVTLDSLQVDSDGGVDVHITQYLGRQLLPGLVSRAVPADLKLNYHEMWRPGSDGRIHGQSTLSAAGGLGSSRADSALTSTDNGCQLRSAVQVEVKIPMLGGQLEQSIAAGLSESIPAMLRFTTTWISEHP